MTNIQFLYFCYLNRSRPIGEWNHWIRIWMLKTESSNIDFWRAVITKNNEKSVWVTALYFRHMDANDLKANQKNKRKKRRKSRWKWWWWCESRKWTFSFFLFFLLRRENGNVSNLETLNRRISAFVLCSSFIVLEFRIVLEAFFDCMHTHIHIKLIHVQIHIEYICCLKRLRRESNQKQKKEEKYKYCIERKKIKIKKNLTKSTMASICKYFSLIRDCYRFNVTWVTHTNLFSFISFFTLCLFHSPPRSLCPIYFNHFHFSIFIHTISILCDSDLRIQFPCN